jgi:hypothetical protein
MAASHCVLNCDKIAKYQSSVLAGNSGHGGRQLQQGSGEGARLSTVGPLQRRGETAVSVWSWILNFVIFIMFFVLFILVLINSLHIRPFFRCYFVLFGLISLVFSLLILCRFSRQCSGFSHNYPFKEYLHVCTLFYLYPAHPPPVGLEKFRLSLTIGTIICSV